MASQEEKKTIGLYSVPSPCKITERGFSWVLEAGNYDAYVEGRSGRVFIDLPQGGKLEICRKSDALRRLRSREWPKNPGTHKANPPSGKPPECSICRGGHGPEVHHVCE